MRKRFFVNGKPVAGSVEHAPYLRVAHVLLDQVKQRMQMGSLQQLGQQYTTETGVTVRALSRFGQDEIWIDVPVIPANPQMSRPVKELETFLLWVSMSDANERKTEAHQYNPSGQPTGKVIRAIDGHYFTNMICAHGALWSIGGAPTSHTTPHPMARYDLVTGAGAAIDIPTVSWAGHLTATRNGVIHVDADDATIYVHKLDKDGAIVARRDIAHTASSSPMLVATNGEHVVIGIHNQQFYSEDTPDDEYWLTLDANDLTTVAQSSPKTADIDTWTFFCSLVYSKHGLQFHAIGNPYFWMWGDPTNDVTARTYAGASADALALQEIVSAKGVPSAAVHVAAGSRLVRIHSEIGTTSLGVNVPPYRYSNSGLFANETYVLGDYSCCVAWDTFGGLWMAPRGNLLRLNVSTGELRTMASLGDFTYHSYPIAVEFVGTQGRNIEREMESTWAHQHRVISNKQYIQADLSGPIR